MIFGKGRRYTNERKRRAQLKLDKAKQELQLTKEVLGIEREEKVVRKQINLLEIADKEITKKQLSLMTQTNKKLITAQKDGMEFELKKSLPAMLESRHQAGERMMGGSIKAIQAVKERAKS